MKNNGKKFVNVLKKVTGSSSSGSSSHRSSTPAPSFTHHDEQAESQAPEEQAEQQEEEAPDDSHIEFRGDREFLAYNILKNRTFGHMRVFDEDLLEKTGMDTKFASVWKAVGWSAFADISELESQDLTIQFLCTLVEIKNEVSFCFFGKDVLEGFKHHFGFSS